MEKEDNKQLGTLSWDVQQFILIADTKLGGNVDHLTRVIDSECCNFCEIPVTGTRQNVPEAYDCAKRSSSKVFGTTKAQLYTEISERDLRTQLSIMMLFIRLKVVGR